MSINDEISDWLIAGGSTKANLNDMWFEYWDSLVVPAGHFNDRMSAWLLSIGYTGSVSDMWKEWLAANIL